MKRIDDEHIALSSQEVDDLRSFIYNSLYSQWDHHTNNIICTDSEEDGMRRMNPEMYDFMDKLYSI